MLMVMSLKGELGGERWRGGRWRVGKVVIDKGDDRQRWWKTKVMRQRWWKTKEVIDIGGDRQRWWLTKVVKDKVKETLVVKEKREAFAYSLKVWKWLWRGSGLHMFGKRAWPFCTLLVSKNGVHEHRMSEEDNSEDILLFLLLFLSFYRLDFTPHFWIG